MRIAVTGVGLLCSLGHTIANAWSRIAQGERGITTIRLFDTQGFTSSIGGQVHTLSAPDSLNCSQSIITRTDIMALHAASEAIAMSQIDVHTHRVGLIVGGTTAGMFETEVPLARAYNNENLSLSNDEIRVHALSSTVAQLQESIGPFLRTRTLCSACSSGANAIVLGATWLKLGVVDAVVVGGVDSLCQLTFAGFNALGVIDSEPARPFDWRRKGMNLGEGAGFLVLESETHAQRRNAVWDVEFISSGITSDAHHITNPNEHGELAAYAIQKAVEQANISIHDIDYINAHGTATLLNDRAETNAITRVFGEETKRIYLSSIKGQIGHTLGAAGAIEAVVCVLAIRDQRIPPTGGLEQIDPACAHIRHVPQGGITQSVRVALSNSFGFGGANTVLAFAKAGYAPASSIKRHPVFLTQASSYSTTGLLLNEAHSHLLTDVSPCSMLNPYVDIPQLDTSKARRFDATTRQAAQTIQTLVPSSDEGIIVGTKYGNIDACSKFLARFFEKGPRFVPPSEFPNLVPSSPTGHLSIYFGMHGAAFSIINVDTNGEEALLTAYECIAAGEVHSILAGNIEHKHKILGRTSNTSSTEECAFARLSAGAPESSPTIIISEIIQITHTNKVPINFGHPVGRGIITSTETLSTHSQTALSLSRWGVCPVYLLSHNTHKNSSNKGLLTLFATAAHIRKNFADSALVFISSDLLTYVFSLQRA